MYQNDVPMALRARGGLYKIPDSRISRQRKKFVGLMTLSAVRLHPEGTQKVAAG